MPRRESDKARLIDLHAALDHFVTFRAQAHDLLIGQFVIGRAAAVFVLFEVIANAVGPDRILNDDEIALAQGIAAIRIELPLLCGDEPVPVPLAFRIGFPSVPELDVYVPRREFVWARSANANKTSGRSIDSVETLKSEVAKD